MYFFTYISRLYLKSWAQAHTLKIELNPKVMVQVGAPGDSGIIQISDMLFTVKGPTAGAILVEWNVHESTQGSGKLEIVSTSLSTEGTDR
jgi:hypothetical protein